MARQPVSNTLKANEQLGSEADRSIRASLEDDLKLAARRLDEFKTDFDRAQGQHFESEQELYAQPGQMVKDYNSEIYTICQDTIKAASQHGLQIAVVTASEILLKLQEQKFICDTWLEREVLRLDLERKFDSERGDFLKDIVAKIQEGFQKFARNALERESFLREITLRCGFGEVAAPVPSLPIAPPKGETYDARTDKSESAPEFIRRVYGPWLNGHFTRPDLRKIDPKADVGLRNWERDHNCRADIVLPTKKEVNSRLLERPPESLTLYERVAKKQIQANRRTLDSGLKRK